MNVVETNKSLKQTKRNETKRKFFDHAENVTNLKIENFVDNFKWLFVDLMIWCEIVIVCDFYFYFLSNDVSTFQENDYCKNHFNVNEQIDSKTWKSFIDWMSTDFDEQENRLLIVVVTNSLIDWFSKQKNQLLTIVSLTWKYFM